MKKIKYFFIYGFIFVMLFFIFNYILIFSFVPSSSMENTIHKNSIMVGCKFFSTIKHGDIVIFISPKNNKLFVKRVIGLPEDKIEIKNNNLFINNKKTIEPYLSVSKTEDFGPYVVPKGNYFLLGDNRNHSSDSRDWGAIPNNKIIAIYLFSIKT